MYRFYSNAIDLYKPEAKRMSSCGAKGFVVTAIRIQCPVLLPEAAEIPERYFSCRLEIQAGDYRSLNSREGRRIYKIQMTCSVNPNELTEVTIDPPLLLPSGFGKGVRITAEV